jgi:hypothetical protein
MPTNARAPATTGQIRQMTLAQNRRFRETNIITMYVSSSSSSSSSSFWSSSSDIDDDEKTMEA